MTRESVDDEAEEIVEESIEMGDAGAASPPDGQRCQRDDCYRDAVPGPGDEWLCKKHQLEFFRERHG